MNRYVLIIIVIVLALIDFIVILYFPRSANIAKGGVYVITQDAMIKECKFLGNIPLDDSKQSRGSNYDYTNNISYLRSRAVELGANVVVLDQHQATPKEINENDNIEKQDVLGSAYFCPNALQSTSLR